jgi:hypothetical protein
MGSARNGAGSYASLNGARTTNATGQRFWPVPFCCRCLGNPMKSFLCSFMRLSPWAFSRVALTSLVVSGAVAGGGVSVWAQSKPASALDAQDQRVAQALTRALRARVSSPGRAVNIQVTPTSRSDAGYFSQIVISGRPAKVKKLQISELDLRARNVRVDVRHLLSTGEVRTLSSRTTLRAVVSESDLTRLLGQGKRTRDMGLRVKYIDGGRMRVTGNLNYTLLNGPVTGIAKLRLAAGSKVHLDILSLQLRGHEVPQFVKDQFASRINPVIDYQDLPFQPQFKGLSITGPRATLRA